MERHQRDRGPEWTNIEEEKYLSRHDLTDRVVVIDCVTLWGTNFFFDNQSDVELSLSLLKEKFGEFYYNITLVRTPYLADIEFLNKLGWTNYKDFLAGKMDIGKNIYLISYRLSYISDFINEVPISEEDLKTQIEELLEKYKNIQKSTIDLCQRWLDKLNSGVKVKEL